MPIKRLALFLGLKSASLFCTEWVIAAIDAMMRVILLYLHILLHYRFDIINPAQDRDTTHPP